MNLGVTRDHRQRTWRQINVLCCFALVLYFFVFTHYTPCFCAVRVCICLQQSHLDSGEPIPSDENVITLSARKSFLAKQREGNDTTTVSQE